MKYVRKYFEMFNGPSKLIGIQSI